MGYDVTYHPVDPAWASRYLKSKLEGPIDSDAESWLFKRVDQIENIMLIATVLANELGPRDEVMFAAEGRPYFIIEENPEKVADSIDKLLVANSIEEIVGIMAEKAAVIYGNEKLGDIGGLISRNKLEFHKDVLKASTLNDFFAELAEKYKDAQPKKKLFGVKPATDEQKTAFAYMLAGKLANLSLKIQPAWYLRNMYLTMLYELEDFKDFRSLCGTVVSEMQWARAKIPDIEKYGPTHFESNYAPGVYIPPKNVKPLLDYIRNNNAEIKKKLGAHQVPEEACNRLFKMTNEICTYSARHNFGILEITDIVQSMMMGGKLPT